MSNYTLPPLPASDDDALAANKYDGFYKTTSRSFWGEAEVIKIEDKPMVKCDHEFIRNPEGAKCTKCHFGLIGPIEVQHGKLFYKGEPLGL